MNIVCENPLNPCQDPTIPTANYSSEAADVDLFFAQYWRSPWCRGTCVSSISQEDANLCAARHSVEECQPDPPRPPNPPPPPDDPPNPRDLIFYNREQTCISTCHDGLTFSYTVRAGVFAARYNQATADAEAYSYACNQARERRICLGSLPAETCSGAAFSESIPKSGGADGTWSMQSGELPTGLTLNTDTGVISGTPTVPGSYTFTVRFTSDEDGDFMEKVYTMCVVDIRWDSQPFGTPLEDATVNEDYNLTFNAPGCAIAPLSYQVVSGSLPTGMTLNESTGALSGAPSVTGTFAFTIRVQTQAT